MADELEKIATGGQFKFMGMADDEKRRTLAMSKNLNQSLGKVLTHEYKDDKR
jgi:hypothetical protein